MVGGIRQAVGRKCPSRTELARVGGDVQLAGWRVSGRQAPSGWEWKVSQSSQGATELVFPGPALGKMQGEAALAAKRPEGRWFSPTPYFRSRMAFSILGVAAMVGLQRQGFPVPVGDEAVIAVAGKEGQLGTGRGLHPPDDEPHRRGVGLSPEGSVGGLRHSGGAVHPVRNRRPVLLGYGLDEIPQAGVLADGDGKADIRLSAGGHHGVGVEARCRRAW